MFETEYSQGVDEDGPVLLKDGQRVGIDELLADISALQLAADRWTKIEGWREADWPEWFDRGSVMEVIDWAKQ